MKHSYPDIHALTDRAPLWHDSHGTPRFAPFEPGLCPSIYATEVALVEIECSACRERFLVEMHWWIWWIPMPGHYQASLSERIQQDTLHYGDPPFHQADGHQCSGTTMNCNDLRVVEYWSRAHLKWRRKPELEMRLERPK